MIIRRKPGAAAELTALCMMHVVIVFMQSCCHRYAVRALYVSSTCGLWISCWMFGCYHCFAKVYFQMRPGHVLSYCHFLWLAVILCWVPGQPGRPVHIISFSSQIVIVGLFSVITLHALGCVTLNFFVSLWWIKSISLPSSLYPLFGLYHFKMGGREY